MADLNYESEEQREKCIDSIIKEKEHIDTH